MSFDVFLDIADKLNMTDMLIYFFMFKFIEPLVKQHFELVKNMNDVLVKIMADDKQCHRSLDRIEAKL